MRKPTRKQIEKILGIIFFVVAFVVITQLRMQDRQDAETAADHMTYTTEQTQSDKVPEVTEQPETTEPPEKIEQSEAIEQPETTEQPEAPALTFRNDNLLSGHYEKHGIEMGFSSKEEYQAAAAAVVGNPKALHKVEEEDGDDVYYVEDTNEFVVVSTDGYIRTYFNPDDGIDYFNRQ